MALTLHSVKEKFDGGLMPIARTIYHNGSHLRTGSFDGSRPMLDGEPFESDFPRNSEKQSSGIPGWVPWALGGVAVCAICYGLLQIDSVRDLLDRATEPIKDFFSGDEFEDSIYSGRSQEDESDFGSGDFGSSASERLRSQL